MFDRKMFDRKMFAPAAPKPAFQIPSRCEYVQWPPVGQRDRHPRLWTSLLLGSSLIAVPFGLWLGLVAL